MSVASELIKRYFSSTHGHRIKCIVEEVEHLAALTARFLQADFVILFSRRDNNSSLVPVAYESVDRDYVPPIGSLDSLFDSIRGSISDDRGFLQQTEGDTSVAPHLQFGRECGFGFAGVVPFYEDGEMRGGLIAYWKEDPGIDSERAQACVEHVFGVLRCVINQTDELRHMSEYFRRISSILPIFEISVASTNLEDLFQSLLGFAENAVPHADFGIMLKDAETNRFELSFFSGSSIPSMAVKEKLSEVTGRYFVTPVNHDQGMGEMKDFTVEFEQDYSSVVFTPIAPDKNVFFGLVGLTRDSGGFTESDRELLSVFSIFARTVLKDALLVRNLRKANQLLKKSSRQMADVETMAALADMAAGVAHDFNNIVGAVIGRIQLLKLKVKDEVLLGELDRMETTIMSGADTIKRIQQFTSSAKSKELKKVDLYQTLSDYLQRDDLVWTKTASAKSVSVVFEAHAEQAVIDSTVEDLSMVLDKLLQNAAEHANNGSTITISLCPDGKYNRLSIANEGPAIPRDIRSKIFYPFFTTKGKQGSGLGLSVVHAIVVRHGGKVSFSSDAETGTVFHISFPNSNLPDADSDVSTRKSRHDKLSILIVDDDDQIREVLHDMLAIDGHTVTACADGYAAVKAFRENAFDIMITDLGMPGMSGLELAGQIHEEQPDFPIAMITGWGTQLHEEEVAMKGVRAVLAKPFHLKDIKHLIQELTAAQ